MNSDRRSPGLGRRRAWAATVGTLTLAVAAAAIAVTGGFSPGPHSPPSGPWIAAGTPAPSVAAIRTFTPPDDLTITANIVYGAQPDGTALKLDVCSPPGAVEGANLPAMVVIHAGSWTRGNKAQDNWRTICQWLASEGFVTYSMDYRLAPEQPFPAGVDDVAAAILWIRQPAQVDRFGIDPSRMGAFGGSSGANMSAFIGARGSGPLTEGARVAAVVELSGPMDLTADALVADGASERLQRLVRRYLDCESLADCPAAAAASPAKQLDPSDPPVFMANSTDEFVPLPQATHYAADLAALGIDHELVIPEGKVHSIGFLDAGLRARIAAFLHRHLGD